MTILGPELPKFDPEIMIVCPSAIVPDAAVIVGAAYK